MNVNILLQVNILSSQRDTCVTQLVILALERQIEALTVESRRGLISEKEKYEIKERSLHNKLSEIELDLTRSRGEIT